MATETIRINGREYVSHDSWTFGDYGGCGDIGLANIRVILAECEGHVVSCSFSDIRHIQDNCPYQLGADALAEIKQERPWALDVYGDYSSRCVYVRKPLDKLRGWTKDCDDYPSLSDDEAGVVAMEWEQEAWESWLKSDLLHSLPEALEESVDRLSDDALFKAYREAMEETNTYPEYEYSGVSVDVERIADAFARHVGKLISVGG